MKKKLGCGCLVLLLLLVALVAGAMATDLGQWMAGLVLVYGGVMLAGALANDVVPGEVVEVKRAETPSAYYAGSIRFTYKDGEGNHQTAFRRVGLSTDKFRTLKKGDPIDVWVCKAEPAVVRLVGYGTHEPEVCGAPSHPKAVPDAEPRHKPAAAQGMREPRPEVGEEDGEEDGEEVGEENDANWGDGTWGAQQ